MVLPGVCCLPLSEYASVIRFIRAATIRYPNTKFSILGASMEKRAFIAVGLSIAVFYLFSMLFGPDKQKVNPSTPQDVSSGANSPVAKTQQLPVSQNPAPVSGQSLPSNAPQKDITVDTDLYTAVFSSRGASLKSMTLKKYREENRPEAKKVTLGSDSD